MSSEKQRGGKKADSEKTGLGRQSRPAALHTGDSSVRNVTHFTFTQHSKQKHIAHAPDSLGVRGEGHVPPIFTLF